MVVQSQLAPLRARPKLDVRVSSNQAAGQLTVVTANNVPFVDVQHSAGKFGGAAGAVFHAEGLMTLGQMAPRMSPGLRPPPLFRCAIRPSIIFK